MYKMRVEYVFFLIGLRMTTSFLLPVSFQRCGAQRTSRNILWSETNIINSDSMLEPLDHFVSEIASFNKNNNVPEDEGEPFQIVSRGSNDLPTNESVETKTFYDPTRMDVFVAILGENSEVDISKICDLCSNDHIVSVPPPMVQSLFGFPIETLPLLGHYLKSDVASCTIIVDRSLVDRCRDDNLCIIGGAGHPYWKLLLTKEAISLLTEMDDVVIADIIGEYEEKDENKNEDCETIQDDRIWVVSSTPSSEERESNHISKENKLQVEDRNEECQKPFFPINGPSIHIARLIIQKRYISNPLSPVYLTTVGRIGNVKIRTKRSLRCEFLPPSQNTQKDDKTDNSDSMFPWMSVAREESITVDLLFGKVFLHSLGTKQGEKVIQNIQEGQLLQIEARTDPGQRESIEKWVNNRCLELILMDCQLLSPGLVASKDQHDSGDSKLGKKKSETSFSMPILTLEKVFDKYVSVNFVDNLDSMSTFSDDITKVLSRTDSMSSLVGIDCEWQPREFMENPNLPQPVLLLQISFHELQKIYLLDLQALLRPLMPPDTPMNEVEGNVSDVLSRLMKSKQIVKVGYQLSSDLRRIFASYPHIPSFQEVRSTLEISSFIKRVLHVSKQKKSRYITMSLAAMTSHYLEMTLDKKNQLTDWALRDLTPEQLEYAALDAAVTPKLMEKVLESIEADISIDQLVQQEPPDDEKSPVCGPVIRRTNNDDAFLKEIVSYRFRLLPECTDKSIIRELRANQIVGSSWIASTTWTSVQNEPGL